MVSGVSVIASEKSLIYFPNISHLGASVSDILCVPLRNWDYANVVSNIVQILLGSCLRGMGAPKAKENTPGHVAETPKKRSGPSPDSDSGLLQGCVSLQSPPDLTQMGVGAAVRDFGIGRNGTMA